MSRLILILVVALASIVCLASSVPLEKQEPKKVGSGLSLIDVLADAENSDENNLLFYEPVKEKKGASPQPESGIVIKKIEKPNYENLERETTNTQQVMRKDASEVIVGPAPSGPVPKPVLDLGSSSDNGDSNLAANVEKIAFNSREVRLVGPNRRPVEMKDDIPSKVVVALENLQKEAKDVWGDLSVKLEKGWGDVSGQLEKGWGDLKTMVEGVVSPSTKKQSGRSL